LDDEANDCSAGVTLRSFAISPFTGDFVHRLDVAAEYAGSCAGVREHAGVGAFEEKQWFEPRRAGSLWFGGVLVFVCVELAAAE
jgi:hypothetical protein